MTCLLDVNVLLALSWPTHPFHRQAHAWTDRCRGDGFATCPLTQLGFVRISSNTGVLSAPVAVSDAMRILDRITSLPRHEFWPDSLQCRDAFPRGADRRGHRQLTDGYLIALAKRHGGKLATFDQALAGEHVTVLETT